MKHLKRHITLWALLALLATSCTDDLFESLEQGRMADDGIQFGITTTEQAFQTISLGQTRAATPADSAAARADAFAAHALTGNNPWQLQVHRMPLPLVGIHERAVHSSAPAGETRAAKSSIITDDIHFHDSLTIWGLLYDTGSGTSEYLFNQTLLKKIRNWRSSVTWPYGRGTEMQFYAVAPSLDELNIQVNTSPTYAAGTVSPPTFTYTLPERATEMRDLLFGTSEPISVAAGPQGSTGGDPRTENLGQDNKMVNLTFHHVLTAIRFAKGTIPSNMTINRISLTGIKTKGTYDPSSPTPWSSLSGNATYTLYPEGKTSTSGTNTYIDGDSLFFMIPHTLGPDAKLQIELTVTNDDLTTRKHTLEGSLEGDVWKTGYTMTYKITVGELEDGYYMLHTDPTALEHGKTDQTGQFTVHSYRNYIDYSSGSPLESTTIKNNHPIAWTVEGYSEKGESGPFSNECPSWMNAIANGSGGYNTSVSYTLHRQEPVKGGNHQTILSGNHVSERDNLDLSRYTLDGTLKGDMETANCYIVNATGSYTFPLAYGNRYMSGGTIFTDHQGAPITQEWIKDQILAKNPAPTGEETSTTNDEYVWSVAKGGLRAVVVWQDVDGLISSVSVNADNQYYYLGTSTAVSGNGKGLIGFTIPIDKATPGNAVIALQGRKMRVSYTRTDNGEGADPRYGDWTEGDITPIGDWETFWTWHIWMTDEVYKNLGNNNDYHSMPNDSTFLNYDKDNKNHLVSLKGGNHILPVNLGWVPDSMDFVYYDKRDVWVKLKQSITGSDASKAQTAVVHIQQHARQPLITGTSTVYQWGRPTALPMIVRKSDSTVRPIYNSSSTNISSNFQLELVTDKLNLGEHLTRPTSLLRWDGSGPGGTAWFNPSSTVPAYWGSTNKTLYDPCPPGFQVPSGSVFSVFSKTGSNEQNGDQLNMWPDSLSQKNGDKGAGGYLYTQSNPKRYDTPLTYIPVTGEWQGDEAAGTAMPDLKTNNTFGIYWCADDAPPSSGAPLLWICPEWTYEGKTDKPAIGFAPPASEPEPAVKYSSAQPIRPVAK